MNGKCLSVSMMFLFLPGCSGCDKTPNRNPPIAEVKATVIASKEYSPEQMANATRELQQTLDKIKSETDAARLQLEAIRSDIQKAVRESGDRIGQAVAKNAYDQEQKQVEAIINIDIAHDTLHFLRLQERHKLLTDEFVAKGTNVAAINKMDADFQVFLSEEKKKADTRREERRSRLMAPIIIARKLGKSFE